MTLQRDYVYLCVSNSQRDYLYQSYLYQKWAICIKQDPAKRLMVSILCVCNKSYLYQTRPFKEAYWAADTPVPVNPQYPPRQFSGKRSIHIKLDPQKRPTARPTTGINPMCLQQELSISNILCVCNKSYLYQTRPFKEAYWAADTPVPVNPQSPSRPFSDKGPIHIKKPLKKTYFAADTPTCQALSYRR